MLTKHNKAVVGGMYFQKRFPHLPVIYNANERGTFDIISDFPAKTLIPVGGIGMGVCLIKVSALKKLGYTEREQDGKKFIDFHAFEPFPATETCESINGEDLAFCKRCGDNGIKIYADTGIQAAHITERAITEQYYRASMAKFTEAERQEHFSMKPNSEV